MHIKETHFIGEELPVSSKSNLDDLLAVRRLHKYLYAIKFTIFTDHIPLLYLLHTRVSFNKATLMMLQRWALHLSAYSYNISRRPGNQISQADYL